VISKRRNRPQPKCLSRIHFQKAAIFIEPNGFTAHFIICAHIPGQAMTIDVIAPKAVLDSIPETPFHIMATDLATRARRTLKHGDTFAVFDSHGDIGASSGGPDGLFHNDTRFLSQLTFLLNDCEPLLLNFSLRDDNTLLAADLTNPDILVDGQIVICQHTVHIVRTIFLWRDHAYQRFAIRNYGDRAVDLRFTINFDNDFADLFEVRGMRRKRRGVATANVVRPDRAALVYLGLDGKQRRTTLSFNPPPAELTAKSAVFRLALAPSLGAVVVASVGCDQPASERAISFESGLRSLYRERRLLSRGGTTIETSNHRFNEVLCRSMADLHMLITETPQGRYPYAGIPWYSTTFGRDGLITALQMLWFDPSVARGVLRRLAYYQATTDDPAADAQPGKILHEMRQGEMAALGEIPFGLYYGSVDSTPLFALLAGLYVERTGDLETFAELWPAIEAAFAWIDGPGDPDGDGFVEYQRASELGLANQGWKDSGDAIFHADGRLAEGAIALAEVQGYVFAARRMVARWARRLGHTETAVRLNAAADRLAERFDAAFWCPELETYALALDGDKAPCRVRASNAGQLLFTGMIPAERAAKVADDLLSPDAFSGWGIRTLARGEARYNPMSYHNGSIWPHDNALIALGLGRYGMKAAVERVFKALFDAATYMELRRLPELFCGFPRQRGRGPTLYPVACSPQAWASATPFSLLEASLGLEFDHGKNEVRLRNPRLPEFLDEVLVRNLKLGRSQVDLRVRRYGTEVSVDIPHRQGNIQVSVVLS
jgi:glycogen debranching enzyme